MTIPIPISRLLSPPNSSSNNKPNRKSAPSPQPRTREAELMEGDSRCYYSSNNWDLHAVVRFARGRSRAPPAPSADDPFSFLPLAATDEGLPDPDAGWQPLPDLPSRDDPAVVDDLFRAFFAPSSPPPPQPQQQQPAAAPTNEGTTPQQTKASSGGGGTRSRRKKKQVKKAVQRVPADCVSADPWAWRKYGQKPIKGSPYPRGYYRCSSDKECKARKMVERCSTDPDTFVLTYTGDHSHPVPVHRNSLAGTTRHNQLPSPEPAAVGEQHAPPEAAAEPCPAPSAWPGLSPATPLRSPSVEYGQEEEEEEFDAAGGDELAPPFLKPDEPAIEVGGDSTVDGGAGTAPIVNIVEETFVFTPWVTATGDALSAADGGWR